MRANELGPGGQLKEFKSSFFVRTLLSGEMAKDKAVYLYRNPRLFRQKAYHDSDNNQKYTPQTVLSSSFISSFPHQKSFNIYSFQMFNRSPVFDLKS